MTALSPWTLDFETEPIDFANPHKAPKPVGLAVRRPDGDKRYLAWGHPTGNNATIEQARQVLEAAYRDTRTLLFHNAQFDLAVARQHFGLPWPDAARIEDTRLLAFLADPYRERLSLKDLADDLLAWPPLEQEELFAWIRQHVPEARRKKNVGAWIGSAPGNLVAPYAIGDVERTYALWRLFAPVRRAFPRAYRLEVATIEVAQALTENGVPVHVSALEAFERAAPGQTEVLEREIRKMLGLKRTAEFAGDEGRALVADALERKKLVRASDWVLTKEDRKRSLASDDLAISMASADPKHAEQFLVYWRARGLLAWQLSTLVKPWLARVTNGRVHVSWDTTRNAERGKLMGARTGRLSSTPNFQNVGKEDPPGGLSNPRTWVRAPREHRLVGGDLMGQEPRIMAHFAGGRMMEGYRENPLFDPHADVAQLMRTVRVVGKVIGLAVPYGRGIHATALQLGRPDAEAKALIWQFWAARPELRELFDALKLAWATGKAIVTWAGVEVKCEETPDDPGRWSYTATNALVQRSAAEQLKQAMVTAHAAKVPLILSVHDELVACAATDETPGVAKHLKAALENTGEWRVPFVADVKIGTTWRSVK